MHHRHVSLLALLLCVVFSSSVHAKSKKHKRASDNAPQNADERQEEATSVPRREIPVPCPLNARGLVGNPGDTQIIVCPAQCSGPMVWGTDVYADDSSICVAARHAGAYDGQQATQVMIEFLPGQKGYRGSEQNGITTYHWGTWPRSFAVHAVRAGQGARSFRQRSADDDPEIAAAPFAIATAAPADDESPTVGRNQAVDCSLRGDELPGDVGARRTVRCPAACQGESVWGSGPYTDDSSVCAAAIHAGALPLNEGGLIRVIKEGPLKNAKASKAHGIESHSWRYWPRSFRIEAAE